MEKKSMTKQDALKGAVITYICKQHCLKFRHTVKNINNNNSVPFYRDIHVFSLRLLANMYQWSSKIYQRYICWIPYYRITYYLMPRSCKSDLKVIQELIFWEMNSSQSKELIWGNLSSSSSCHHFLSSECARL